MHKLKIETLNNNDCKSKLSDKINKFANRSLRSINAFNKCVKVVVGTY